MKFKFLNILSLLGLTSLLLTSCIKDEVDDLGNEGDNFLKILESPENQLFFSVFTDVKRIDLFSVRRDAATTSALNQSASIKLQLDTAKIRLYNEEHDTEFELLPDSLYTLGEGIVKSGDIYTMTLNAGDFAKDFAVNLNGAKWDVSHKYAMAFNIIDSAGLNLTEGKKDIMAFISVKNKYDGRYEVTGTFVDMANATFTSAYPLTWDLVTSGPNSVIVYDNVNLGVPGFLFNTPAGASYYGNFGLEIEFNPETNAIVGMTNYYGQPAVNTRSAVLDPSGANKYDPATSTISIKYFMLQPSVVPAPPHIRSMFNETWTYKGPR